MSLPVALLLPVLFWTLLGNISSPNPAAAEYLPSGPALLTYSVVAHLVAHALFGIPIFYRHYSSPGDLIWDIRFAVVAGAFLGLTGVFVAQCIVAALTAPSGGNFLMVLANLLGAGYGVCSAVGAWLARPAGTHSTPRPDFLGDTPGGVGS